jgi:hypothetical protein
VSDQGEISSPYIDVVFHQDTTPEQRAIFLEVLGDLFEAAGGKSGLRVESVIWIEESS